MYLSFAGISGRGVGFDRLDAEIVGLNPAYGMVVCLCVSVLCCPIVDIVHNFRK
jgi:hypothetical protein